MTPVSAISHSAASDRAIPPAPVRACAPRRRRAAVPVTGHPDRWHQAKELYALYHQARAEAARPDLRWHDLRHTGAVLAAAAGATLAELMARLGHSTAEAALRYQHAAADRDKVIAARMSQLS